MDDDLLPACTMVVARRLLDFIGPDGVEPPEQVATDIREWSIGSEADMSQTSE